jgi:hypothetical protein
VSKESELEMGVSPKDVPAMEGSEGVMAQVTSELRSIAVVIEGVTRTSTPSFDLLEISRAIQMALVLLNDWGGS